MEPVSKAQPGSVLGLIVTAVLVGPCVGVVALMLATLLGGTSWFLDATASPLRLIAALVFVGWGYVIFRIARAADRSQAGAAPVAVAAVLWSAAAGLLLVALAQT